MRASLPKNWTSVENLIPWALFLGLFLLNACLVSPFIGWYDSGEMVAATVSLGLSHPSGQVLFHLLGKIFLLIPFGSPAFRLGLMSAACSSLASVLFWTLACRLAGTFHHGDTGTQRRPKGKNRDILIRQKIPLVSWSLGGEKPSLTLKIWLLLLTLAWSLSLPWWRYSVMPLVYSLHLFLALLLLWVLTLPSPFKWRLAFLVLGAATIFRPTQAFAIPFVALAYFLEKRTRGGMTLKGLLFLAGSFALGRSTVLYLPLRSALHPVVGYWDLTHPWALVKHVLALRFSHFAGTHTLAGVAGVLRQMALGFWTDLTPVGVGLIIGGVYLWRRARSKVPSFLWVGMGWGLLEALFVLAIPFPAFEPHQVLLLWVFSGFLAVFPLAFLDKKWGAFPSGDVRRERLALTSGLLALFALVQFCSVGHLVSRRGERGAQDYARNVLELMGPQALYVPAEENEFFPVVGYQQSFGFRKDVEMIEPGVGPSAAGPRMRRCLEQGRPLYVTRKWEGLPPGWSFQPEGPMIEVTSDPGFRVGKKPPQSRPLASWGGLELLGAQVSPPRVEPGGRIEMIFRWGLGKGEGRMRSQVSIMTLFTDEKGNYWMRGNVVWLHDIHETPFFAGNMKPGLEYVEKRVLLIPSDFPPGTYFLMVGLQKGMTPKEEGRETFNQGFYERSGAQNLDKFMGRGETGAVVQFSTLSSGLAGEGLWPLVKSAVPPAGPHFVPAARLEIIATDEH